MYILTEKLTSTIVVYMILKRLLKNWTDWDAYKNGIIDKDGKRIKKPRTAKEREGWDILDRFCWSLKRLVTKFIGDKKFVYLFSTAYLMKENCSVIVKENFHKYKKELDEFTASQQLEIYNLLQEMEASNLIMESKLDLDSNLFKIVYKTEQLLKQYNIKDIFEKIERKNQLPKSLNSILNEDGEVSSSLGDVAQFTHMIGSPRRIMKRKIIFNNRTKLKRRCYKWQR